MDPGKAERKARARSITQGILGLVKILVKDLAKFTEQLNEKAKIPNPDLLAPKPVVLSQLYITK